MKMRTSNRRWVATPLVAAALTLSAFSGLGAGSLYRAVVTGDGALGYYRFNDSLVRNNVHVNSGSLGAAGDATNTYNLRAFPGAIVGSGNRAQFFDTGTSFAMIPYNEALNPDNGHPFTVEAWFYPASDQISSGMSPINNRYAGANRQGWVFFQRAQDLTYVGKSGYEGVGWNCRMYNENGSSSGLDVASYVPFLVGQWTHVAVVYDPVDITNATLTMYINGQAANTNIWTGGADGTSPGYVANTSDHDVALSLGAYNNSSGAGNNPYFGGIDEFAFYAAKLSPAQLLAHYQNGTNANRTTAYDVLIKSDNPVAYLRLDELPPGADIAINMGDARAAGNATNTPAIKHPGSSALAGRTDDGSHSGHYRGVSATGHAFTSILWTAENNPDASFPFTFESWFRPTGDQQSPGPSPVNNRLANGVPNRTGWVIYQRDPNVSYQSPYPVPGQEGVGWTFRMYTGNGSSGSDVLTGVPYDMGAWAHLVVTWEPQFDMGMSASGSEQWNGILTAYVNGFPVASNLSVNYAANVSPTEDGREPADLAIGAYNLGSGLGEEFEGDVDEVAFYNGYVLTPDQVLAHYMTATNSHPATNYETLVLTAAYDGAATTPQRTMPKTYLRFNEPAYLPAANSGSLGAAADGSLLLTANTAAGPTTPTFVGFDSPNPAVPLDGATSWASLNNPSGLNISGQITLEAWINPAATQGDLARIISHGPPTVTVYDTNTYPLVLSGSQLSSNEVSLRIEGAGASYAVGASDGTTVHGASAAVTAGDLGGGNGWLHLVGTYDGANWRLFRNGVQIASAADAVGALPVKDGEWAIGSTGMGWEGFFAGAIDEVAIYNTALTPATVQAHYYVATSGAVSLAITQSGGTVTVHWPAGTLQHADALTGSWSDVPGATAPSYSPAAGPTKKFYRVKL